MLLEAPQCRGKIKTLCGGDYCVVLVRRIPVLGGEVDWRVFVTDIDAELGSNLVEDLRTHEVS